MTEGFKTTELGMLPEEWKVVKLGDVAAKMKAGGTPNRKEARYWNGTLSFVLIGDLSKANKRLFITDEEITEEGLRSSSSWLVPKGNIIYSLYGTVGKVVINEIPVAITQNMAGIIPNNALVDKEFLYYCLTNSQNNLWNLIDVTVHKHISITKAKQIPIITPPLPEQKKIAAVLSTIQEAKEKTEEVIKATRELKKSLMKHLFTYGPVPLEEAENVPLKETEIGLVPEEWEVVSLGNKGRFQYGYTTSATDKNTGTKFLRITDIKEDGVIEWNAVPYGEIDNEELQKFKLIEGDILFARIGATTGKTCIIKKAVPKAVFASYLIRFISNAPLHPIYLFYYTQTEQYRELVNAGKEGKLKKGLNANQLKSFKIPLSPLPIQQQIADILSTVDKKIETEENKKKALEELFKTLLYNLMTGKIRVNHLEIIT